MQRDVSAFLTHMVEQEERALGIVTLKHGDVDERAQQVALRIKADFTPQDVETPLPTVWLYPVPRGGVPALYAVLRHLPDRFRVTDDLRFANAVVDDLVESGATRERCIRQAQRMLPFYALYNKKEEELPWLVFPWEGSTEGSIEDATTRLLQFIGEDPNREGLRDTPGRVARAWQAWTCGYKQDPAALLRTFEEGSKYDEMVVVRDIPFYSHCEHHLAPFFGTASIAYVPNGRIVGLSKLPRLLEVFARRLQVQERLTQQVADALMNTLQPRGAAVRVVARHLCMESRGVCKAGSETVTNALRGVFFDDAKTRSEFLQLVAPR